MMSIARFSLSSPVGRRADTSVGSVIAALSLRALIRKSHQLCGLPSHLQGFSDRPSLRRCALNTLHVSLALCNMPSNGGMAADCPETQPERGNAILAKADRPAKPVIAYVRVSSKAQGRSGLGLD